MLMWQSGFRAAAWQRRALRRLQHPYIIRYAAAFEDGGNMHLQMEYHAQGSLRAWIGDIAPAPERRRTVLRQVRYY